MLGVSGDCLPVATLADARKGRARVRWQVYRRDDNGHLVSVEQSHADRVKSESLCCWLRLVGTGDLRLIRIGLGLGGEELFLTGEEHERELKEHEREQKEHEREQKEHERELKEQALALAASEHSARVELEARLQALLADRAHKPTSPRKKSATRKR